MLSAAIPPSPAHLSQAYTASRAHKSKPSRFAACTPSLASFAICQRHARSHLSRPLSQTGSPLRLYSSTVSPNLPRLQPGSSQNFLSPASHIAPLTLTTIYSYLLWRTFIHATLSQLPFLLKPRSPFYKIPLSSNPTSHCLTTPNSCPRTHTISRCSPTDQRTFTRRLSVHNLNPPLIPHRFFYTHHQRRIKTQILPLPPYLTQPRRLNLPPLPQQLGGQGTPFLR